MTGYKIRYQLVRRSGMDVDVGNPAIVLVFDRFVFAHTITGLEPYSEYKVEIFGYSSVGDGPANVTIASEYSYIVENVLPYIHRNQLAIPSTVSS